MEKLFEYKTYARDESNNGTFKCIVSLLETADEVLSRETTSDLMKTSVKNLEVGEVYVLKTTKYRAFVRRVQ